MENKNRFYYAFEHITDKSVFIVDRNEWVRIVDVGGEPVILDVVPPSISGLVSMAAHVMTAGSGIANASPGIDVVRDDPNDKPYVYNIDHYTVFEHFVSDPLYPIALKVAGIEETEELNEYIQSNVFVVGPYRDNNHWVAEIPNQIREAKRK